MSFKTIRRWAWLALAITATSIHGAPIHVVVWDEQQPEQKKAYPNFLGNEIASHLRTFTNLSVTSVALDQPQQGLAPELLDQCDVLVWWGHKRHPEFPNARAKQIVRRIEEGKLALIALHSAHWSEPFVEAMRERTKEDARKKSPASTKFEFITPPRFEAPKFDSPLTPSLQLSRQADGTTVARVTLPRCVFPTWRADGAPSHVTAVQPQHPIARGVPVEFDIPQTEMYGEPFHVPAPDAVIFEEKWDKGEHFSSGCVWSVGKGKVFYFRPGHETYPVFVQPIPLRIVSNAVQWMGEQVSKGKM